MTNIYFVTVRKNILRNKIKNKKNYKMESVKSTYMCKHLILFLISTAVKLTFSVFYFKFWWNLLISVNPI